MLLTCYLCHSFLFKLINFDGLLTRPLRVEKIVQVQSSNVIYIVYVCVDESTKKISERSMY